MFFKWLGFLWDAGLGSSPGFFLLDFRREGLAGSRHHSSPAPSQLSTIIRLSVAREGYLRLLSTPDSGLPRRGSTALSGIAALVQALEPWPSLWREGILALALGLAPCSVVSPWVVGARQEPRRLLSSLTAGLTPSELAGPQGVTLRPAGSWHRPAIHSTQPHPCQRWQHPAPSPAA